MAGTLTLDYALWANVISRLEVRCDRDLSQKTDGALFDLRSGGGAKLIQTVAFNVIYKF